MRQPLTALRLRARFVDPVQLWILVGLAFAVPALAAAAAVRPGTTLLAVAVLLIAGVTLLRMDLALMLVIATGPLEAAFSSGSGGVSVTKVAGALAFASFAFHVIRSRRVLVLEPMQAVLFAILAIALLSASQSAHANEAMATVTRYASFVLVYVVISQLEPTPQFQRMVAWTLALAATASSILGLRRFFVGQDNLATLEFADPNDYAFMLCASLPLIFWLLGGRRIYLPVVLAMIGTVLSAIMLSLSRGAMVGLGAGVLFLVVTDRRRLQLTLVGGLIGLTAAILVIHSNPQRIQYAVSLKQHVARENVTTRFEAWSIAARLAADNPVLGVGPGNFRFYYDDLAGRPVGTQALAVVHDAYLDIAAELGVVAMALFLAYLGTSFMRLTISNRRGDGLPGFAQAVRISLVVSAAGAITLSEQYYLPFWLIGGLATALWADGERRTQEESPAAAAA